MSVDQLKNRLKEEVLVLDGAMGTMIMRENLAESDFRGERFKEHPVLIKGCNDILVLTRPEVIYGIHAAYLKAGADIISTDTFNANRLSLADYQLADNVVEICREGARLARKAVDDFCSANDIPDDRRPFVAGSMGPTGVSLSISREGGGADIGFSELADVFAEQATALIEGGVDILLMETIFDILNAKAAAVGINRAFETTGKRVPVIISATLTPQGRLLSGQTLAQFLDAMSHYGAFAYGLNCGMGAEGMAGLIEELSALSPVFVSMHPNAGLPDELGYYKDTPEIMLNEIRPVIEKGLVNIIGGCCGTTPDHIRLIAGEAKRHAPRGVASRAIQNPDINKRGFLKIGERCNVAGSRKFLRLVREEKWGEALEIAEGQLAKGAGMLDVNMDDSLLDAPSVMKRFASLLTSDALTADTPLMIDSSDFDVISGVLPVLPLKGIVNSISLKNGEEEFIVRARYIYEMGFDMVVMGFDEKGQADTLERRKEIFTRAYSLLTEAGIPPTSIVFDPNVLAVATGIEAHSRYGLDFLESISWIKENLPATRVSGGISNLSFSFRGIDPVRKAMHSIFLELAISRGLDMAIINPATPLDSEWVDPELKQLIIDLLLCKRPDATDRLLAYALELKKKLDAEKAERTAVKKTDAPRDSLPERSASEMLADVVLSGDSSRIEELLPLAIDECGGSAMRVVESALMKGMDRVGAEFAAGNIFLPQVVRSADVMKKAVNILTPLLEKEQSEQSVKGEESIRPKVVLATVKGDVHDIGKNIVSIVLRCSGFDVIDLGVMTPPEKIVDTAVSEGASAIALSGLITPSLHEMAVVAKMMEERRLTIPLFVGGATTSDLHTAVCLAPKYSGPVVHTDGAASLPGPLSDFISAGREEPLALLRFRQAELADGYHKRKESGSCSLSEARSKSAPVDAPAAKPRSVGEHLLDIPVNELVSLINWRPLLHEWGLNPAESESSEAKKILQDAREILAGINGSFKASVVIMPARRDGDDIILEDGNAIPTIRSLTPNPVTGECLALSDFVAQSDDHIALFAATGAGSGLPEEIEKQKENGEYQALLMQSVAHRLAEAATEWMHRYVRETLWGLPEDCGIRPAVGYSCLPDQSLVEVLDRYLDYDSLGISLTENGALYPSATTTGLIIAHPSSRYFETSKLTEEALNDYSRRRGRDLDYLRRFLS